MMETGKVVTLQRRFSADDVFGLRIFRGSDIRKKQQEFIKSIIMPQLISYGNEMLRISAKGIEYSTNSGRSWIPRYSSSFCGSFIDLLPYGNELLAVTTKGVYYSTNEGRSWIPRYTSSFCGEFRSLADNKRELLANTSKGLYYSTNGGRSWIKRS